MFAAVFGLSGFIPDVVAQELSAGALEQPAIEALIGSVNADINLSDAEKAATLELLQLAMARNGALPDLRLRARQYADALTTAPLERAEFDARAANIGETELSPELSSAPLAELELRLARYEAELAALRRRSATITGDYQNLENFDIQGALAEARQQAAPRSTELDDSEDTANARTVLDAVTRVWQDARIEMLEQRLSSRNVRLARSASEIALVSKQIAVLESDVVQLRALVTGHRQSEANRTVAEINELVDTLENEPPAVRALAEDLGQRAVELEQLVARHDGVIRDKETVAREARRLEQNYGSLTEQLEIAELNSSPEFGAALRRQRDLLNEIDTERGAIGDYEEALTRGRLAQFQVEVLRDEDTRIELSDVVEDLRLDPLVEITTEREAIIQNLLTRRDDILARLSEAYGAYIGDLAGLVAQSRALGNQSAEYANLLDQHLLWMPSANPMGLDTLAGLGTSVVWLVDPDSWMGLTETVFERLTRYLPVVLLVAAVLFLLLRRRSRLITTLVGMKTRVGKVHLDKMALTLIASLITMLLALPGPLMMASIAGLVNQPGDFAGSLASALLGGSILYLILEFFLQSTRSDGLLQLHFKWSPVIVKALKRNLPWFMAIFLPAIVLNLFVELQGSAVVRDSLGRVAFVAATLVLATFAYRVLYPEGGILRTSGSGASGSTARWQIRYLAFPLLVLLPILIAGLSIYGYHYTAVQLDAYLLNSALIALLGALVFSFLQRAFAISQRQLALERVRAERAAALAQSEDRQAAEAAGEGVPTALELQEIDLQTISTQTNELLKVIVVVGSGLLLWNVWADFFPAFRPLADIRLWEVLELTDGVPIGTAVTLWDLLLTVVLGVITFAAAKNIPGLLEVAFLSHMSLETGTSYAITTIARYLIVMIGSTIAFQTLGVQWSELQWLIAALGVGIGFGLQEIVANFVSGIVLLFERPIRIGDTVTVGEQWGTVSRIRMRATTITDWDRREVVIPNKTFITERLINWTLSDPITRQIIHVGIAYGSDIKLAEKLLMEVATANDRVLSDPPPAAMFLGFGDNSLEFELRVFVKGVRDFMPVVHEIHVAIDGKFREHGVEIAFPQRDIHFDPKPIEVHLTKSESGVAAQSPRETRPGEARRSAAEKLTESMTSSLRKGDHTS